MQRNFICAILTCTCIILFATSCNKAPNLRTDVVFLGHKGNGSNNYNEVFIENTLPSVQHAVEKLDGSELDIQMSLDDTPWIWHNTSVSGYVCGSNAQDTIPKMRDSEIERIKICHKNKSDRIYKLSEILAWSNGTPNGIYISLDIKVSFSKNTFSLYGNKDGYLKRLATSLSKVFKDYRFTQKTAVEVDSKLFCTTLKSFETTKSIATYFMRYEPMSAKIKNAVLLGYDGLSCNYTDPSVTDKTIQAAKNAGLKIMLWTPYYREELQSALALNPDYIQTDNIFAKQALRIK